jgi:hypothetical protein
MYQIADTKLLLSSSTPSTWFAEVVPDEVLHERVINVTSRPLQ